MRTPKVVGISGVARAGKDTFYLLSEKFIYEELGLSCKRYSLADALKDECRDYLQDNFGLDVYSQDPEIKAKFRPFLVWYGDRKREQTQATYFTSILEKKIRNDTDVDVALITDIRYGEYDHDEVHWLTKDLNGKLVHVQRLDSDMNLVDPPNDNERRNDPLMQQHANYRIRWDSETDPSDSHFVDKLYKRYIDNLREFYLDIVNLKKDVAVHCAVEAANHVTSKNWRLKDVV